MIWHDMIWFGMAWYDMMLVFVLIYGLKQYLSDNYLRLFAWGTIIYISLECNKLMKDFKFIFVHLLN